MPTGSSEPPQRSDPDDHAPPTVRAESAEEQTDVRQLLRAATRGREEERDDETKTHQTDITEKVETKPEVLRLDHAMLTVLTGPTPGAVHELTGEKTLLGRGSSATIRFDDAGVSRKHARVLRWLGLTYILEDLGSVNGTFLNGERIRRAQLRTGDRVQLGPNVKMRFSVTDQKEWELQQRLFEGSTRDALTGLHNRRYVLELLDSEVAYARRHRGDVSVLLVDVDRFKEVNDRFGHSLGDTVLQRVATVLRGTCRTEDTVARYGGDEFLVVLRGTPREDAAVLAARVCTAVSALATADAGPMSVSIGVCSLAELPSDASPGSLVAGADDRLYRAKRAGRNRLIAD